jgi:PIN domain nuclease of toxin-antitoxin system
MDILLDTHVFLWWDGNDSMLSKKVRELIADPANTIHVSAASVWEIAIKRGSGKLSFVGSIPRAILTNGFAALSITPDDAEYAGALDWDHRDPFDRMIVAQCLRNGFTLATADKMLQQRGDVPQLRAR